MTAGEFDVFRSAGIRGYAAEQEVSWHGNGTIGLNVFGSNEVARNLYRKARYRVMSMHLRNELQASI